MNNFQNTNNDTRTLVTVILLILFYPAGLILMWMRNKWPLRLKAIITIIPIFIGIIIYFMFSKIPQPKRHQRVLISYSQNYSFTPTPAPLPQIDVSVWKDFSTKDYYFNYPSNWKVTSLSPTETMIKNSSGTLEIYIGKIDPVVNFTKQNLQIKQTKLTVSTYDGTFPASEISSNSQKFINMTNLPKGYNIVFGSGSPLTKDETYSLSDYNSQKNIGLTIISTLSFN